MNNENNQNQNTNAGSVTPVVQPVTTPVEVPTTPTNPSTVVTATTTPVASSVGVTPTPVTPTTVNPTMVTDTASNGGAGSENSDPNAIVNENLKKVEINYTPPSKFKIFCLVSFFVLLIVFVLFLPEISSYIRMARSGDLNKEEEVITTGILDCTLSTQTTNLDKKYDVSFTFTDSKLESTQFIITTRGDITLDANTLDNLNNQCKELSKSVKQLNGVRVSCDYTNDTLVEKQSFQLADLDADKLDAAFVEAGANTPGYSYGQNIDKIEQQMNASKYTCERRHSS